MKIDMEYYRCEDEIEASEDNLKRIFRLGMLLVGVSVSVFLAIVTFN